MVTLGECGHEPLMFLFVVFCCDWLKTRVLYYDWLKTRVLYYDLTF